ncbi:putative ribosomal large subunit pseudouridine synthase SVR1, chloroplastic [Vitis vinifera]|uniref:Putative ribosomal large subunit pseudouridine synthase SVR1, chloroplastic n=1 Tax=Vitis vinifera TaxID=29760 RepID=A0A438IM15_VITVI|nr:putative ribosomal large subunit pseudouridine synthase SVR1, chloroplastic [Vitis vinifera]
MAAAGATAAAAVAAASAAFSSFHLSRPSLARRHFRSIPIRSSISPPSTTTAEFNISFAPKSKNPKPQSETLLIPWIVRDENGNLRVQSTPPERYLQDMAKAKALSAKKKKKKEESTARAVAVEPKYSKAARRFYNENFRDPPQRLSKVLAAAGDLCPILGNKVASWLASEFNAVNLKIFLWLLSFLSLVASRRNSEELIFEGRVTVNGSVCNTPQTRVDPARDMIYVNGNRLPKKLPPKVYLALNKPKGYICSSGEKESKSVLCLFDDYLKSWNKQNPGVPKPRIFTVGRLDVATTGLIILTNDGMHIAITKGFCSKLSHPSSKLSKEYIATIDGVVNKRHLIAISEGTVIEGVHCTPDSVELLPPQPNISKPRLRVVVHEGRNHEVRELVKSAGLQIHSLKRIRIGGFRLPSDLGLKVNLEKSILSGINIDLDQLNRLALVLDCKVLDWLIPYLGLPLGWNPKAGAFWDLVIERVSRRFGEHKRDHLVSWDLVCKAKGEGVLEFEKIFVRNCALLGKWLWRFPEEWYALWH